MLQIAAIVVGIMAVVMGITALTKGELQFSPKTKLQGTAAKTTGAVTLLIGLGIIAFAIFVFPRL